jgi:hypothetical protein
MGILGVERGRLKERRSSARFHIENCRPHKPYVTRNQGQLTLNQMPREEDTVYPKIINVS